MGGLLSTLPKYEENNDGPPTVERGKTQGLTRNDGFDSIESDAVPIDRNDNICNRPEFEPRRPQQSSPTEPQGFTSQRPQQPQFTQQQRQPPPQPEARPQEKPYNQNYEQQYYAENGPSPRKEKKGDNCSPGCQKNYGMPTFNQNINSKGPVYSQQIGYVGNLQIGNTFNLGEMNGGFSNRPKSNKSSKSKHTPHDVKIPAEIIACKTVVDAKTKKLVCREIGYNWKRLARELDLEDCELEEVEHDYHKDGLREMAFKMLDTWCRKCNDEATIGVLAVALCEIGRVDIALKIEIGKS